MTKIETIESEENSTEEIFGSQKVKLYKIKHIIFDFGGVMVEKTHSLKNIFDIIESDLKINIHKSEDLFYKKIKRKLSSGRIDSREFLEKLFNKYYYPYQKKGGSLPPKKVNIEYYLELWFQLYNKFAKLSYDMTRTLKRFKQAGYTVSLMSNVYDIHAKSNELKGFYNIFDYVFLSNEIGLIKPDFEKYKYMLKKLDAKPKNCIFIDDKIKNLVPARNLGFVVVKFDSFEKFNHQLDLLGFKDIEVGFREEINKKYKQYKARKAKYKKIKKEYKKAKKKKKKKNKAYQEKRKEYKREKETFKNIKEKKKQELEVKVKINKM